jgi:phosphatidylglycerophosphate synthase
MACYRKTSSLTGGFFDKYTDQLQVNICFAAVGYAAYVQSQNILPVFLAFAGVAFYNLRGYTKYITIYTAKFRDRNYLEKLSEEIDRENKQNTAGLGFGVVANLKWFVRGQRKILFFDEGVFIFMLALALVLNTLTPMLWVFALTQIFYGLFRSWQRGSEISNDNVSVAEK